MDKFTFRIPGFVRSAMEEKADEQNISLGKYIRGLLEDDLGMSTSGASGGTSKRGLGDVGKNLVDSDPDEDDISKWGG